MLHHFDRLHLLENLRGLPEASQDVVLFIGGAMGWAESESLWKPYLDEAIRVLKPEGLLFVQGLPEHLPAIGVYLDARLQFKYWIAIESLPRQIRAGLPSVHAGILMFAKGERFHINRLRVPHEACKACGRTLHDWGGKAHLMHPEGSAISDVWKHLPLADNYARLSEEVLKTLLKLVAPAQSRSTDNHHWNGVIAPREGLPEGHTITRLREPRSLYRVNTLQYPLPGLEIESSIHLSTSVAPLALPPNFVDAVIRGDALEVLKRIPDESVDVVFADPPYNLDKAYNVYEDEKDRLAYLKWCESWLSEYIRVLKPSGSLFVLNLPRWAMYHAHYLNRRLYFQNWIVWDALSEPRGKLMPAHYALLFYTKHPTDFVFNYEELAALDARFYCLRSSCIRQRKARSEDEKEPLTDFWWDIHRIKHRRDRDYHPCQLPDALMERIIRLTSRPGDVVLDALAGTGTTAVVAARLGRHYLAIDIDELYVQITREKIAQVKTWGEIQRTSLRKPRASYTKKALQLELRELARQLGRLPTPEDVQRFSRYGLQAFIQTFPTWGKALKAAKLEIENGTTAKNEPG